MLADDKQALAAGHAGDDVAAAGHLHVCAALPRGAAGAFDPALVPRHDDQPAAVEAYGGGFQELIGPSPSAR
jgi:hypothetical protein